MSNFPPAPLGPRANAVTVTPGATIYNPPLTLLWIGTGGTLAATMAQSGTIALSPIPVGWLDDIAITNVGTATTCTNITGFW